MKAKNFKKIYLIAALLFGVACPLVSSANTELILREIKLKIFDLNEQEQVLYSDGNCIPSSNKVFNFFVTHRIEGVKRIEWFSSNRSKTHWYNVMTLSDGSKVIVDTTWLQFLQEKFRENHEAVFVGTLSQMDAYIENHYLKSLETYSEFQSALQRKQPASAIWGLFPDKKDIVLVNSWEY